MAPVNGQILPDKWFVSRELRPEAPVRLVCFPHAGGATAMFARWPAALGPGVEVAALALPGRERRIGEPAAVEVEPVQTTATRRPSSAARSARRWCRTTRSPGG